MGYTSVQQRVGSHEVDRGALYELMLNLLGVTGTILPIGDPLHAPAATTFKTIGAEQVTFTYSKDPTTWDDLQSVQGLIPVLTFDGVDEEADTPDAAYWSRDDAAGANGFSIGIWANVTNVGVARCFMAKFDESGAEQREWVFFINSNDTMRLFLFDESANVDVYRNTDSAITMNSMRFFVATYDGAGGATAANGIKLYEDGAVIASSATNDGSYVGMEDLAGVVSLGRNIGGTERFFPGSMAGGPLGPFFTQIELTADQVLRLYELGRRALEL